MTHKKGGIVILKKYIGNKAFYRSVITIALPIVFQNAITNLVSLIDNVMVSEVSTEAMSAVSIVNQFVFIFNLVIYGAVSAAGIFTAQYFGNGNDEGIRHTFRFKIIAVTVMGIVCTTAFLLFDDGLINLFLLETVDGTTLDPVLTFNNAKEYLSIAVIGLMPYAISQVYTSTLRETNNTIPPMIASFAALFTNIALNGVLIFGLLGAPALGVRGAAIATVISRFVELVILFVWAHVNTDKYAYMKGVYSSFKIPLSLVKSVALKSLPLITNEFLWSLSVTLRNQCYSTRGLDAVAATNICATVSNLFSIVYFAMGAAIAIMVGNLLGAGRIDEARDTGRKLTAVSIASSVIIGGALALLSPLLPSLFNTGDNPSVYSLAVYMLIVTAVLTPISAYNTASYHTIRSGGKILLTMFMDSGFMFSFVVPISLLLAYFTPINIFWLYAICQGTETVKVVIGALMLKYSGWANQIIKEK